MNRMPLLAAASLLACASGRGSIESADVLSRQAVAPSAEVKHVLLGWAWLGSAYRRMGMQLDSRAESRTEQDTEALAQELLGKLRAGAAIEPMMAEHSEDPGSAKDGRSYTVDPASRLAEPFKELSLRLLPGEAGIARSQFGLHVVKRVR